MRLRLFAILTLFGILGVTAQIIAASPDAKRKPTSGEQAGESEDVIFNARTKTFHKPSCHWAEKCRTGCQKMPRAEAVQKGGAPCKACGG